MTSGKKTQIHFSNQHAWSTIDRWKYVHSSLSKSEKHFLRTRDLEIFGFGESSTSVNLDISAKLRRGLLGKQTYNWKGRNISLNCLLPQSSPLQTRNQLCSVLASDFVRLELHCFSSCQISPSQGRQPRSSVIPPTRIHICYDLYQSSI